MKCGNCGRSIDIGPLCLDCQLKQHAVQVFETRQTLGTLNSLLAVWDWQTGYVAGVSPKFTLPPAPMLSFGDSMQINIPHGSIGVLNAGTITNIESAIGTLMQNGDSEVAELITRLKDGIVASTAFDQEQKELAGSCLALIAEQAAKPPVQRTRRVILSELSTVAGIVSGVESLSSLLQKLANYVS